MTQTIKRWVLRPASKTPSYPRSGTPLATRLGNPDPSHISVWPSHWPDHVDGTLILARFSELAVVVPSSVRPRWLFEDRLQKKRRRDVMLLGYFWIGGNLFRTISSLQSLLSWCRYFGRSTIISDYNVFICYLYYSKKPCVRLLHGLDHLGSVRTNRARYAGLIGKHFMGYWRHLGKKPRGRSTVNETSYIKTP